jgi:hypothetical protein
MPNADIRQTARLIDWSRMIEGIDRALSQAADGAAGRADAEHLATEPRQFEFEQRIAQTAAFLKGFDDCLKLVQARVGQCDVALATKENAVSEWLNSVRSIRQALAAWHAGD